MYYIRAYRDDYKLDEKNIEIKPKTVQRVDFKLFGKPNLIVSTDSLEFGFDLDSLSFEIKNEGKGELYYTYRENDPWIEINDPENRALQYGDSATIIAKILRSGLEFKTHKGEITIISDGGDRTINIYINRLKDIDNNLYKIVTIGEQVWMAENLKTGKYTDRRPILYITNDGAWAELQYNGFSRGYRYLQYKSRYGEIYGALYNWPIIIDPNGLCPVGWHVPTHADWTDLIFYIGGAASPNGNKLKSCKQVNSPLGEGCNTYQHPRWDQHSTHYGTDDYGYAGLPGGYSFTAGAFYNLGIDGRWWSSTEASIYNGWYFGLFYSYGIAHLSNESKTYGFSVRCIKD
jgi:uncharacterized protein (TIGR02145 family)